MYCWTVTGLEKGVPWLYKLSASPKIKQVGCFGLLFFFNVCYDQMTLLREVKSILISPVVLKLLFYLSQFYRSVFHKYPWTFKLFPTCGTSLRDQQSDRLEKGFLHRQTHTLKNLGWDKKMPWYNTMCQWFAIQEINHWKQCHKTQLSKGKKVTH